MEMVIGAVSIVMTFVSARAVIVWIINLVFLVIIFKITIRQYKIKQSPEKKKSSREIRRPIRTNSQRIRDWHNFYDSGTNATDKENSNYCDNSSATNPAGTSNCPVNKEVFFIAETFNMNLSSIELLEDSNAEYLRSEATSFDSTPTNQKVEQKEPNTSTTKNVVKW